MICKSQMVLNCFLNLFYNRSNILSHWAVKCFKIYVPPISVKQTGGALVTDDVSCGTDIGKYFHSPCQPSVWWATGKLHSSEA